MPRYRAIFQCEICGDWTEGVVVEETTRTKASYSKMDCPNCDGQDTMEVVELMEDAPGNKHPKVWRIKRDEPWVVQKAKESRSKLDG